ncbi:hypothetical protein MM213_03930 [Belliella sp. R4-6]|uniref:Circularly permuted ATP-grasp type 2 n=1 Tax=Belliella alkalica TaxID=1730871 RepID=A0ABS9V885_9BACT|nr:hypothetical protein [Belliella alkalica]MCH7412624.1 hypothetical protein [Belliella alkalica]
MIQQYRTLFNREFSPEKHQEFIQDITSDFNYLPTFRIAESPFFISENLKNQLIEGTNQVVEFIKSPEFKKSTQRALDLNTEVPNEDSHTQFLAVDFGICEENGEIIPKLIEVQGFPSVFNFQQNLYEKFTKHYPFLEGLSPYFNGLSSKSYLEKLREVILSGHDPKNVILLEIEPEKQNTKIDFYYCSRDISIPTICVTDIIKKGKKLYYKDKEGRENQIHRIYNRVIFDELDLRTDLKLDFDFKEDLEVEWAGHPNWFFRISKYILPYLKGPYFIDSTLLSELESIPEDLENYVLKPLFSFSGSGVIFHVQKSDIEAVKEKDLYILQKKVNYVPVLQAPDAKVKAEVRMLLVWPEKDPEPTFMANLVRLSRGEMIGVKFNKDKDWVGGTIGLFEN